MAASTWTPTSKCSSLSTASSARRLCRDSFPLFERLLRDYDNRSFIKPNGQSDLTTNVTYITEACLSEGLVLNGEKQTVAGFTLYPKDYFCPKDWLTKEVYLTENSYAIHHFDGSWAGGGTKFKHAVMRALGPKGVEAFKKLRGDAR